MRSFYRLLRVISAVTLFFFAWSFLPLWQAVAYAAAPEEQGTRGQAPGVRVQGSARPEERFEKALDALRENVSRAGAKAVKGEDDTHERETIKAKRVEIDLADVEFKKEFSATEKKLKDAKLPKEILDRHAKFVKNYENNLKELRTNLDGVEQAKTGSDRKAKIETARLHLERVKAPSRHQKLDPNNLPFRARKAGKTHEPRLKKEEFERDFPQRKRIKNLASLEHEFTRIVNSASRIHHSALANKPVQLAFNGPVSDMPLSISLPVRVEGFGEGVIPQLAFTDSSLFLIALAQDAPTADDLAQTTEVQFTQDIIDLATQLNHSPVKIYEWVRNNIEFVPTYGSIQGADMCLQSKQCNDIDTASLLIALLRTSNLPAKYAYGTIDVPIEKAMNWVGGFTDARAAANFIASGNVPVSMLNSGGTIKALRLEHVWVETYIPYGNYRGAMMDDSLKTWVPMDGSFKQYTYTNGFDITAAVPFSQDAYLGQVQSQNALHYYQSQIQNYLDANMPDTSIIDVKGYRGITQEIYHFLPSTLPYITAAQGVKFSSIPASMVATVAFSLTNPTTGDNVSYTVSTPELAGKRITVSYIPATSSDEALIANYGGFLYNVPAYMLNLKPVLRIEGVIKLTGDATTLGAEQNLTMQFTQPNGNTETRAKKLLAGAYYAVGLDLQGINENVLGKRNYQLNTNVLSETAGTLGNDDLIGEHLFILATTYFFANDKVQKSGAKLYNTVMARTISEGITSFTITVSNIFGMPKSAMPSGINMDVAMLQVIASAKDGDVGKEQAYMSIHGLVGSYNEHDIFEKIDGFASTSAVRALQVAAENNIPIKHINATNIGEILPMLQVGSEINTEIQNAVNAGKEVTIPQSNVQINDWNGVGYIVKDTTTGAGAYMISGGLAGSDSTNKDDGMQVVELFKTPLGWIKDMLDLLSRSNIAEAAELESFELIANEAWIESAIAGSINYCATYAGIKQCTGLVYKAYKAAGIYLFGESLRLEGGNYKDGLDIIWSIPQAGYQTDILVDLTNKQQIYKNAGVRTSNDPLKGDIIFFKNTYKRDKNKDISQQGITHVGIVMDGPDSDGDITFAQASTSVGVVPDSTLNIAHPDAYSTILRKTPKADAQQLFVGFGTIRNIRPNLFHPGN